jgi:DNA-binding MarR family transcriptional regulator
MASFVEWLTQQYPNQPTSPQAEAWLNIEISSGVGLLNRYAKHYSKKMLQDTPLASTDDLLFLIALATQGAMNKSALIQMHLLEITTGTEVIKRLLRNKLVTEQASTQDRRAKEVAITPEGLQLLGQLQPDIQRIGAIIAGNLNTAEKQQIVALVGKLKRFHEQIHEEHKKAAINTIFEHYLQS